eukprot:8164847-Alexandrium_andersonii.AAC.1
MVNIARKQFRRPGLELNFAPGKSELFVEPCGPNSRALRQELLLQRQARMDMVISGQPTQVVLTRC